MLKTTSWKSKVCLRCYQSTLVHLNDSDGARIIMAKIFGYAVVLYSMCLRKASSNFDTVAFTDEMSTKITLSAVGEN